jgi:hypothetical protein
MNDYSDDSGSSSQRDQPLLKNYIPAKPSKTLGF